MGLKTIADYINKKPSFLQGQLETQQNSRIKTNRYWLQGKHTCFWEKHELTCNCLSNNDIYIYQQNVLHCGASLSKLLSSSGCTNNQPPSFHYEFQLDSAQRQVARQTKLSHLPKKPTYIASSSVSTIAVAPMYISLFVNTIFYVIILFLFGSLLRFNLTIKQQEQQKQLHVLHRGQLNFICMYNLYFMARRILVCDVWNIVM